MNENMIVWEQILKALMDSYRLALKSGKNPLDMEIKGAADHVDTLRSALTGARLQCPVTSVIPGE